MTHHHPALRPGFRVMKVAEHQWAVLSPDNSILHYCDDETMATMIADLLESAA